MKKTLLILGLAGVMFTACDPVMDKGTYESTTITSENFLNGATFTQFDKVIADDGTESYVPSETGNYIQYDFSNVPAVTISYIDKNGETKVLSYGRAGGLFYYLPSRGSEPLQTLYFSYINADGTEVVAEKQFTLKVAQALEPAVEILVSDKGVKKWKWMPTEVNGGAVWGNGGYCAGEQDGSLAINGSWWGCGVEDGTCPDKFSGQANHAGDRYEQVKGETYSLSYMEFNEDGSLIAYDDKGNVVNTGSFSIKNYDQNKITNQEKFSRGTLETSEGAILWPFAINQNGLQPTIFDVGYLDAGRMVLLYSVSGDAWSECTWWSFMSDDDPAILATHEWRWKPTEVNGGAVWGNGGYCAGSQNGTGAINGAWWGCGVEDGTCPDKFSGQMQHAGASYIAGEEYSTSKMVFNADQATITLFDKDGKQIRQGSYSVDLTPNPDKFSIGTLNTSAGAILWPFAINQGGMEPTSFEIGYLGSDAMVLIFAPEGTDAYGECTWWSFGK